MSLVISPDTLLLQISSADAASKETTLKLVNSGMAAVIFRVLSTAPKSFHVRPRQGVIPSGATQEVIISYIGVSLAGNHNNASAAKTDASSVLSSSSPQQQQHDFKVEYRALRAADTSSVAEINENPALVADLMKATARTDKLSSIVTCKVTESIGAATTNTAATLAAAPPAVIAAAATAAAVSSNVGRPSASTAAPSVVAGGQPAQDAAAKSRETELRSLEGRLSGAMPRPSTNAASSPMAAAPAGAAPDAFSSGENNKYASPTATATAAATKSSEANSTTAADSSIASKSSAERAASVSATTAPADAVTTTTSNNSTLLLYIFVPVVIAILLRVMGIL